MVLRRKVLTAVAGVLALAACAPAGPTTPPQSAAPSASATATAGFTADQLARIDDAAAKSLVNGMTGAVVSVVDPARGTLLKAYGSADTAGTPLRPDAHYRIASVTKTFTAYAVLRLVDEGKVALTDPVSRYVADIPNGDTITVRDLLAMRSGGYDFTDDKAFFDRYLAEPTMPWTDDDTLAIIRAHAAEFTPPNQQTKYDNSNYVLLGLVIAKASGQPTPQYLEGLIRSWTCRPRPTRRTTRCPSRPCTATSATARRRHLLGATATSPRATRRSPAPRAPWSRPSRTWRATPPCWPPAPACRRPPRHSARAGRR